MSQFPAIQIFITDAFKRQARLLKKRYRSIQADLQPLTKQLEKGDLPGDRISGFPDYRVFKVRVKNSDIRKGKSSGYRVIYQSIDPTIVILLYLYAKSDQDDVTSGEIYTIIEQFQAEPPLTNSDNSE